MFTLQHIADAVDWDAFYPRAVAIGCGCVLNRAAERIAACDELLGLTPASSRASASSSCSHNWPRCMTATPAR